MSDAVQSNKKPWWLQATALVSVSASGAVTGLAFAPGTPADLSAPTGLPVHLLALEKSAQTASSDDGALRTAIVNVATHYLQLARTTSPAKMEALIWGKDSIDGAGHGASCAAFASLTLELAAHAVGQQSWVTGGSTYPWPLHEWADVRVDPNPASMGIVSVVQDAQAHHRWHPLGEGYVPQPGDWVLFDGHIEVITSYAKGVLHTIGGDSLPNYSVNAHAYDSPLAEAGITGFVDNGHLASGTAKAGTDTGGSGPETKAGGTAPAADPVSAAADTRSGPASPGGKPGAAATSPGHGLAAVPGASPSDPAASQAGANPAASRAAAGQAAASPHGRSSSSAYGRKQTGAASAPTATAQHAFINEVAPGAIATQREYGVPASVTIAQAIEESGWGRSELAVKAHNLFGIEGAGPAGSITMPTREYENGSWVTTKASFRAYHDYAESIADHGRLLATASVYRHAMADRTMPDAFAADLAGVYATDPRYGGQLVGLMRLYDLYRFDVPATGTSSAGSAGTSHSPGGSAATGAAHVPAADGGASAGAPRGGTTIPGTPDATSSATATTAVHTMARTTPTTTARTTARTTADARPARARYRQRIPLSVATAFITTAKVPLTRNEPLYRDVAELARVPWQMLAACDWLQCEARPGYSPVHGEKLGKPNKDKTIYRTKSEALGQCAADLIELSAEIYGIDVTTPEPLSVHDLANSFAAFRWGGMLRQNGISAMEFPYSVAGLTASHSKMCWPKISGPAGPDKPGTRFRGLFGAVPILLSLSYPATVLPLETEMTRLILFLLGSLSTGGSAFSGARQLRKGGVALAPAPAPAAPPGTADPDHRDRVPPQPPKRRFRFRWKWAISLALIALVFRRALAYLALTGLSAAVHLVGVNVHLPHLSFAWPWQSVTAGSSSDVDLGPWVLQNIEGITKPALGTENFQFMFTHKVSKNIGPWPCWYAATFNVVGRASATVNLNPGATWWAPSTGHYRLQVLARPTAGKPGSVAVTITLPLPQLPQSMHDVSVDNSVSRPVSTQHSWTYPGFGCGVLLRPQFSQSVLYAQAQTIAFQRVTHDAQISRPLIAAAEGAATRIIRNNFIQPTVNRFGYTLDQFSIRWTSGAT